MEALFGLWIMLGLVGTAIVIWRGRKIPEFAIPMAVLSLVNAVLLGPIWPLIALAERAKKACQFCRSYIVDTATVCPKCTRALID